MKRTNQIRATFQKELVIMKDVTKYIFRFNKYQKKKLLLRSQMRVRKEPTYHGMIPNTPEAIRNLMIN